MKNKVIYYFLLICITSIVIYFLFDNHYEIGQIIELNTQKIISHQNVHPKRLYLMAWKSIKKEYIDAEMNGQDWDKWKNRYLPYIKTNEDAYVAINTMIQSLNDPHSRFMNISQYNNQNKNINSKITGIGITLMSIANKTVISNVIENSPAQKAKLKEGDIIRKINGASIKDLPLEEIVKLIRGEKYSLVKLDIIRNNEKLTKSVERNTVHIKSVYTKILKNNIGYIKITSFMGISVPKEFKAALNSTKDTDALIIDIRGDAGGLLNNAVIMASMIIKKGNIINLIYRNGEKIPMNAQNTAFYPEKPIIVLINSGTASSAEILAGTLRDQENAILIGKTTYGKNAIQKIIPLPNKTGMNLTIAKYIMPKGEDINKKGLKPDIEISYNHQDYVKNRDPQLESAIDILGKII